MGEISSIIGISSLIMLLWLAKKPLLLTLCYLHDLFIQIPLPSHLICLYDSYGMCILQSELLRTDFYGWPRSHSRWLYAIYMIKKLSTDADYQTVKQAWYIRHTILGIEIHIHSECEASLASSCELPSVPEVTTPMTKENTPLNNKSWLSKWKPTCL